MPYNLTFSELIQKQIEEALSYYDALSISLSLKFEENLFTVYDSLRQHPYNYFNLNKRFRRINLPDFPYQIIYTIIEKDNEIFVAALFHQHVNPKRIRKLR